MDVRLYNTPDGGEIDAVNGEIVLDSGLETAVFLSLFGGNERDSGLQADDRLQWWGNLTETDPARRYRSETQHLIAALPLVTANLRRIEEAAKRDLEWMVPSIAVALAVRATMPGLDLVQIDVSLLVDGRQQTFTFIRSGSTQ